MPLFQVAKGVSVPRQWELMEGFESGSTGEGTKIRVNVSLDHLDDFFRAAVQKLEEPVFLIIETPCNEVDEATLRKDRNSPFHVDVYYSNLITQSELLDIFSTYGDLLLNDGFVRFGAASQDSKAEIFVAYYKIVYLLQWDVKAAVELLSEFEIPRVDGLVTAWDLFSEDNPGTKSRYRAEVGDIYEMIEVLLRSQKILFINTDEE